jgi:ribonuclease Y
MFDPQMVMWIVVGFVVGAVITLALGAVAGRSLLGSAKREAAQLTTDAEREAASIVKEANTGLKEQRIQLHEDVEREKKELRKEIGNQERRVHQREETVEKRLEAVEQKAKETEELERRFEKKDRELDEHRDKLEKLILEEREKLETISGLTAEEAKKDMVRNLENEVRRDTTLRLKRLEDELSENSEKKARWIIGQAIQRCAADHVAETTVSVVTLPNDEMKGRIIGREGRNIRAFENATGINVIIDDTPEAVILSGFDPVRREIARQTLGKLVTDGRIHPARIEEIVEKVTEEVNKSIREYADEACLEVDVHGLHPEILKLMGRLHYRTSYGQNVLKHSMEVCHLAGLMASELGVDVAETKRAAFIHDMGKAISHEIEGSHAIVGHDYCKKYGENDVVANAVGAHHNEMDFESITAILVQAADALSAARPGARRETVETYVKRLEQLEEIADGFDGVEKAYALQAGREVRIAVSPDKMNDAEAQQLARDVARKVEQEMTYPGQIRVMVIRETRAVDTAK